jgi:hypothetical protein
MVVIQLKLPSVSQRCSDFLHKLYQTDKVWSDRLANSTVAFGRGDVAMILLLRGECMILKPLILLWILHNCVPQLDANNPVTWASFWAEGVMPKVKTKMRPVLFLNICRHQMFYASFITMRVNIALLEKYSSC